MTPSLLRRLSIRGKLVTILMFTSATVLIVSSALFAVWDYSRFRTDLARELTIQAQIVLENTTAAMSFGDPQAARETLETLTRNRHIRAGCLYNTSGALFAQMRVAPDAVPCPTTAPAIGYAFTLNRLELTENTLVAGRPGGSVRLESDLDEIATRVRALAATVSVVLVAALGLAFALSTVLQRLVSAPLVALAATARDVSTSADFSVRAQKTTDDELGVLVDAFNSMLHQIQVHIRREQNANRLKDEFLAAVSHELRTPLNAILGWLQILRTTTPSEITTARALASLERNARSQSRLIEDLVDVSRIVTRKLQLKTDVVDLREVIEQASEAVAPSAREKTIQLSTTLPPGACLVSGDFARLQQVVVNLLSNAVKFTPVQGSVSVNLCANASEFDIQVHDTGVGITAEFLPQVFERFRQADGSTTREYGGLGLGLAIVQELVLLHGGTVTAHSAGPGKGATFTIRLPQLLSAAEASQVDDQTRTSTASHNDRQIEGLRVLVVDDDADALDIAAHFLAAAGAVVGTARSGRDALAQCSKQRYDVVVCDLSMPIIDGFEVLREIRHLDSASGRVTAAVALTAHASEDFRARTLAAGFQQHLAKPYDAAALVSSIAAAVQSTPRTLRRVWT
jgi:signal transduction histidine kinase/CheY-like chemotaxis protein